MLFFKKKNRYSNSKFKRYDFRNNLETFLKLKKRKKLILGVTVGRSGLKWVLEILRAHKNIEGGGERNEGCGHRRRRRRRETSGRQYRGGEEETIVEGGGRNL